MKEQPLSLTVSQQGHKVAVGFVSAIHVFDGATDKCARLPTAIPKVSREESEVQKSQKISFSVCGNHLVVATREAHEGEVFIGIHDLPPLKPNDERMPYLRLPTVCVPTSILLAAATQLRTTNIASQRYSRDLGLSSIVYDPRSSTICICSSTAQGHTWLINRIAKTAIPITDTTFRPFPGDQIQCATAVPGTVPQFVMVNDSNKVFILRYENSRWKPHPVNVRLDSVRKDVNRADEKMSIAAMDSQIRLFWMQGQEARLLTIDPSKVDHGRQFEPEPVFGHNLVLGSSSCESLLT